MKKQDLSHLLPLRIVKVPVDELPQLKRDPVGYLTRKGATPISAAHPFYNDRAAVREAINPKLINHVDDRNRVYVAKGVLRHRDALRFIHIDLGVTRDAAAIAACHATKMKGYYPCVEFDLLARFVPEPKYPIQIDDVEEIVYAMDQSGLPIGLVTADGFGSTQMLQHFKEAGYNCGRLSVDSTATKLMVTSGEVRKVSTEGDRQSAHLSLKSAFADRRIQVPEYYPLVVRYDEEGEQVDVGGEELRLGNRTWLEIELVQLQVDPVTHLVVKPPGGTDDLAQAVAGACFNCVNNESDVPEDDAESKRRSEALKFVEDQYYKHKKNLNPRFDPTDDIEKDVYDDSSHSSVPTDSFYDETYPSNERED